MTTAGAAAGLALVRCLALVGIHVRMRRYSERHSARATRGGPLGATDGDGIWALLARSKVGCCSLQ